MSTDSLNRLVAEAIVLGGGEHQCAVLGHDWQRIGGRRCPYASEAMEPNCSQTVYQCRACEVFDYGELGGPAHQECIIAGPCSSACEEALELKSVPDYG